MELEVIIPGKETRKGKGRKISSPSHQDEKIKRERIRYNGRKTNARASEIPYLIDE